MGATKRNQEIRARKEALVNQMLELEERAQKAVARVPDRVLNGNHQDAVAWKAEAEKVFAKGLAGGGCSVNKPERELKWLLSRKQKTLQLLEGNF